MMWNENNPYSELIKYYDTRIEMGEKLCPIAHTYLSVHIGVLIDENGNFLCGIIPSVQGELIHAPCTVKSETRTSQYRTTLLHDQLMYVADYGEKHAEKHEAYLDQLSGYVESNPSDKYAYAIYRYVSKNTLLLDIRSIIPEKPTIPIEKMNVVFSVKGIETSGADPLWTEWYLSILSRNGMCCITGERDYIPDSYPRCITTSNGREIFFRKNCHAGYTASQKVIHTIQYMTYGKDNGKYVESESMLDNYLSGNAALEDIAGWTMKQDNGSWGREDGMRTPTFLEILEYSDMNMKKYSEYFGIPYRAVQDWKSGARKCPKYLLDLMFCKLEHEKRLRN